MTIAATIELAAARACMWDALVVGAGPAGSLAARQLALQGRSVLLVDRACFPRWKVCGACLNGWALATLSAVRLERVTHDLGAVPLTRMHVAAWGRQADIALGVGVSLSRAALDAALVEAAIDAGVSFLPH